MAFFNGHIASIKPEIMADIDVLLEYVERQNKQDEDIQVADCASRVEAYLRDYRESEREAELAEESSRQIQEDRIN